MSETCETDGLIARRFDDLLEANKAFVEAVESGAGVQDGMTPDQAYTEVLIQYGHGMATAYDTARAAIAKAEGRS